MCIRDSHLCPSKRSPTSSLTVNPLYKPPEINKKKNKANMLKDQSEFSKIDLSTEIPVPHTKRIVKTITTKEMIEIFFPVRYAGFFIISSRVFQHPNKYIYKNQLK